MNDFEVIARMRVRPGQLDGFKAQAAEMLRLSIEKDTRTLRYDWYIDEEQMECEVHELYVDESGLFEHNDHIMEARNRLFRDFADDHRMSVYAPISPQLAALFAQHAGGVGAFAFLQGLGVTAAVER